MAGWYLAASLVKLRQEINAKFPHRDKSSDGSVGDTSHAARRSDHNPDNRGCVHAIDIDKDGINVPALLREVIGDPRVSYVIWSRRIWDRAYGWRAQRYTGINPHTHHVHVSVRHTGAAETSRAAWFGGGTAAPAAGTPAGPSNWRSLSPGRRHLSSGMTGTDVRWVQRYLHAYQPGAADGRYGGNTVRAVRTYQDKHGLRPTGQVDGATWRAMGRQPGTGRPLKR